MNKEKVRTIPLALLIHGRLRKELKIIFDEVLEEADAYNSCIVCEHFNEEKETCALANGQRPPARTIAYGCEKFEYVGDDVIEAGMSVKNHFTNPASKMLERMSPKEIPRGGIPDKDFDPSKLTARDFFPEFDWKKHDAKNKEATAILHPPLPSGRKDPSGMADHFEDTFFKHHPNHGVEENY